ncbi:hypothetical protein O181_002447 [Austropuccinia psidii MF-1]|uniref:Uncharacterized protein n=1 Tax=Austropuccinia psidii MF-1 TaxID=1389203 RepID=A0A9Q3GDZ4_9BASI|nr:hypothetical protein [Austropuccinia psidii MF-1]
MSQFLVRNQENLDELNRINLALQGFTALQEATIKAIQEGCAKLSKASQETYKRLNKVFEEKYHFKSNRDCLDQNINKFLNVFQNIKAQPQGHSLDNPYQEDIKPDVLLDNKKRYPSQYQDRYDMTYSEKEALKQLPEASSWPNLSGVGEYNHMEQTGYIDGFFIDVPIIPDYWITARLNTALKGNSSIWNTEMKDIHVGRVK